MLSSASGAASATAAELVAAAADALMLAEAAVCVAGVWAAATGVAAAAGSLGLPQAASSSTLKPRRAVFAGVIMRMAGLSSIRLLLSVCCFYSSRGFAFGCLVFQRCLDIGIEQGVAVPRRRFELGMELHANKPRVFAARQLDDLCQLFALR